MCTKHRIDVKHAHRRDTIHIWVSEPLQRLRSIFAEPSMCVTQCAKQKNSKTETRVEKNNTYLLEILNDQNHKRIGVKFSIN